MLQWSLGATVTLDGTWATLCAAGECDCCAACGGCPAERHCPGRGIPAVRSWGSAKAMKEKQGRELRKTTRSPDCGLGSFSESTQTRRRNHIDDGVAPVPELTSWFPAVCWRGVTEYVALNTTPGSVRSARRCLPCRYIAVGAAASAENSPEKTVTPNAAGLVA